MPDEKEIIWDVFLSHSHDDADDVDFIAQRLVDDGLFEVWLDKWILIPGKPWQRDIAKGLNKTSCCAVFVGDKTPEGWFRQEIERALDRQAKDDKFRVLAVLLPNADINCVDQFLGLRSWVDFRNGLNNEKEFHKLFSAVRGVAPGRGPAPPSKDEKMKQVEVDLEKIQKLLRARLIEEDIAKEYQRKLMDSIIQVGV